MVILRLSLAIRSIEFENLEMTCSKYVKQSLDVVDIEAGA